MSFVLRPTIIRVVASAFRTKILATARTLAFAGIAVAVPTALCDTFGIPGNEFSIDFALVGNPGNPDDAPFDNTPPGFSSPYGGVKYPYRMGKYEISEEQIGKATLSGLEYVVAGGIAGNMPATNVTWFEAAAFVNWLNTSTGHHPAYALSWTGSAWTMNLWSAGEAWNNDPEVGIELNLYRHKDAYYFLPSEDEWYKAAYHKNDGVTANYWDYATGSDTIPSMYLAIYNGPEVGVPDGPAEVMFAGGLSPYGTMAQNGNVFDWQESAVDGTNDSVSEFRTTRGGAWSSIELQLRSSNGSTILAEPTYSTFNIGFRIASIPEPSTTSLLSGVVLVRLGLVRVRRRRSHHLCK